MGNLFGLIDEKMCTACGVVKHKTMFRFYRRGARNGAIKYESRCIECKNISDAIRARDPERRAVTRDYARLRKSEMSILRRGVDGYVGPLCKVEWCKCVVCGFIAYYKRASLGSASLANSMCKGCYRSMVNTGKKATKGVVVCVDCGGHTIGTAAKMRCNACATKIVVAYNKRLRANGHRSDRSIVDRARKHGVTLERVNRVSVYDRDGWKCYLCGVQVVRSKTYRPDQATLDHIVPLSHGGPHTYANVMTCCHRCNSMKSNSVPGAGSNV